MVVPFEKQCILYLLESFTFHEQVLLAPHSFQWHCLSQPSKFAYSHLECRTSRFMKLKLAEWTWIHWVAPYLAQMHVTMNAMGTPMITGMISIGKQHAVPAYPLQIRRC